MRGALPSPMPHPRLIPSSCTVTGKLLRARIDYQLRTVAVQMPFPFPAFSTAKQKGFLFQSACKLEYASGEAINSLQIGQTPSFYPNRFEEPVAEGKPTEGCRWLSLPAREGPVATGGGGQGREEAEHALGIGGLYVTPIMEASALP